MVAFRAYYYALSQSQIYEHLKELDSTMDSCNIDQRLMAKPLKNEYEKDRL